MPTVNPGSALRSWVTLANYLLLSLFLHWPNGNNNFNNFRVKWSKVSKTRSMVLGTKWTVSKCQHYHHYKCFCLQEFWRGKSRNSIITWNENQLTWMFMRSRQRKVKRRSKQRVCWVSLGLWGRKKSWVRILPAFASGDQISSVHKKAREADVCGKSPNRF